MNITSCPSCGAELSGGMETIDDYRILNVLQEGYSAVLCRAVKTGEDVPVTVRIYKKQSKINKKMATRLQNGLEQLMKTPIEGLVKHYEIKRSSEGLWYRVSEWIDAKSWGEVFASDLLKDHKTAFELFYKIASIVLKLHQTGHIIPHLILNDIIVEKNGGEGFNIKIDYKLSRFLDRDMKSPDSIQKNMLDCHPDIVNNRPLDFKSDIWSLGKVFLELLTADLGCKLPIEKIDNLNIPDDGKTLLKIMLADEPALRPRSMEKIVAQLDQIRKQELDTSPEKISEKTVKADSETGNIKKRTLMLVFSFIFISIAGIFGWLYFHQDKTDDEVTFRDYANHYSPSVAFVMVEYWLKTGDTILYQNRVEGTAFLVDKAGYMVTNRHVACPWLEDRNLFMTVNTLEEQNVKPEFGYKMLLWFEGQQAYKRITGLAGSTEMHDIYAIESAYQSDGKPRVSIVGIQKAPVKSSYMINSPLREDFAVLRIDPVPESLKPLPLHTNLKALEIPKLSSIITLGFPLGSRTQAKSVNVSVTMGNVRRSFKNVIQVDTSIYAGNSGGPIIDSTGQVIGIATAVVLNQTKGLIPTMTPLSDIGLVLPITKVVGFLNELKSGHAKWNGIINLSARDKIEIMKSKALKGEWFEAKLLADNELKFSLDPFLFSAAGIMHFCTGDLQGSRQLFKQALSMNRDNNKIKLMIYIIDWMTHRSANSPYRNELMALNWQSEDEFLGYLTRILEGVVSEKKALEGWNTMSEKSWIMYVVSLVQERKGNLEKSQNQLHESLFSNEKDDWVLYMALSKIQQKLLVQGGEFKTELQRKRYLQKVKEFNKSVIRLRSEQKDRATRVKPLFAKFTNPYALVADKKEALEKILEEDSNNKNILVSLVFLNAIEEKWDKSLNDIKKYHLKSGRENKPQLSLGLLEQQILFKKGQDIKVVKSNLLSYYKRISDPWYRNICQALMGEINEQTLVEKANNNPEKLTTAYMALGFWAEGENNVDKAIMNYRKSLGFYLDNWWEYIFAQERIRHLRAQTKS